MVMVSMGLIPQKGRQFEPDYGGMEKTQTQRACPKHSMRLEYIHNILYIYTYLVQRGKPGCCLSLITDQGQRTKSVDGPTLCFSL